MQFHRNSEKVLIAAILFGSSALPALGATMAASGVLATGAAAPAAIPAVSTPAPLANAPRKESAVSVVAPTAPTAPVASSAVVTPAKPAAVAPAVISSVKPAATTLAMPAPAAIPAAAAPAVTMPARPVATTPPVAASAATPAAVAAKPAQPINKNELKQKLDFADLTINKSDAAKRVAASSNAEAKAKHKDAQDRLAAAVNAFNAGDLVQASAKCDEATKVMGEAARMVPSGFMVGKAKARYEELVHGIQGLESSYAQNYATISKEPGAKNLQPLDSAKIRKTMDAAKALYAEGKYDKANEMLTATQDEISTALNKMLANRTLSYEMKFDTPEQEYVYELARYNHFEELIPLALEQKQPPKDMLALMDNYVKKGKAKRDQAAADAKQKNFKAAIDKIKEAAEDIESGLKLIGVR